MHKESGNWKSIVPTKLLEEGAGRSEGIDGSAVDESVELGTILKAAEMGSNKKPVLDKRKLCEIQRKLSEIFWSPDFLVPTPP